MEWSFRGHGKCCGRIGRSRWCGAAEGWEERNVAAASFSSRHKTVARDEERAKMEMSCWRLASLAA